VQTDDHGTRRRRRRQHRQWPIVVHPTRAT
jgi:hypothetical protein